VIAREGVLRVLLVCGWLVGNKRKGK